METEERVRKEAARIQANSKVDVSIVVDSVGLGAGVIDRLAQREDLLVGEFNSSFSASDPERFVNLRAEAFWALRQFLEEGLIALPPDQMLFEELAQLRWFVTPMGKIQIESKSDLRSRLGRSPDRADAVAMAFGAPTPVATMEIEYEWDDYGGFVL